jgi:uncharacterized cupin superfamily protein
MSDRPNLFTAAAQYSGDDPPGYRGGVAHLGKEAGGRETNLRLFELPAGESLCPYHYEYVEEWLLLLAGELELRTPAPGVERLAAGAVVCFPAGPAGAHKVRTPAGQGEPSRFVMFSSAGGEPSVAVYPDSDKIGVWVPGEADNVMLRRADGQVPYYDGELEQVPRRPGRPGEEEGAG